MKIQVLIDNISKNELLKEWGLCVYIEFNGKKLLLDFGSSESFYINAELLSVNISQVDYAILSHAHYDHSNGMKQFFEINSRANLFMREQAKNKCYHHVWGPINYYIGIKKGWLQKFSNRITYVNGVYNLYEGVYLLPHFTKDLSQIGKRNSLYVREMKHLVPDSFEHEQSLVFETSKGLVIFNSCSHGGADNIINEVQCYFPEKKIYAIVGGFHLFRLSDDEIKSFAKRVSDTKIEHVITGHCTGEHAFSILKQELGDKVLQIYSGFEINI